MDDLRPEAVDSGPDPRYSRGYHIGPWGVRMTRSAFCDPISREARLERLGETPSRYQLSMVRLPRPDLWSNYGISP
jgi:hypothetical protein